MRIARVLPLALALFTTLSLPLAALDCRVSGRPAASLLFPYFEVDLENPAGATTLISIGNAAEEPVLANVVLWTDCGYPAFSFPIYLDAGAVQPLNLRSLIAGELPLSGPGDGGPSFPGCSDPIDLPELGSSTASVLRAWLVGEPDPDDGLCYSSHRPGSQLATGYATVDSVSGCSDTIRTPLDEGYFEAGGLGRANNDNFLWGDFFLMNGEEDAAQGEAAVPLVADADYFATRPFQDSFYNDGDDRYPLGARYRTRHLNGGGFDGGTDLIFWVGRGLFPAQMPDSCERACNGAGLITYGERSESGELLDESFFLTRSMASRVTVGSEQLPIDSSFGTLDFWSNQDCPVCSPPLIDVSSWLIPIYTAENRFSVGLPALRIDNPCIF